MTRFIIQRYTNQRKIQFINEVLNGGYNVHPVPLPNSKIIERIINKYDRKRINIEKLLNDNLYIKINKIRNNSSKDWRYSWKRTETETYKTKKTNTKVT